VVYPPACGAVIAMTTKAADITQTNWRAELPTLSGRQVTLREATASDLRPLMDLLSLADASRFGLDEPVSELGVQRLLERAQRERTGGTGFLYVVTVGSTRAVAGLIAVRQLDLGFESGEWECTLAPSWRATGAFLEIARLVGSFAFGSVGVHRLEARVPLQNGRANGALRKLGAVQEGVLRESTRRGDEYVDQALWSVLKEDWGEHWVSTAPRVH
jgi:RimJ/RimL family protein N-acetyltransferase